MSDTSDEPYQETVICEARQDEGIIFIKVVAMPNEDAVELDTIQARAFANQIKFCLRSRLLRATGSVSWGAHHVLDPRNKGRLRTRRGHYPCELSDHVFFAAQTCRSAGQ